MRRDDLLLAEIVVAIERIIEITTNSSSPEIEVTRDRRDSLLWNFTVLGEAANQVSSELKAQHPEVPWADASRTRNRIVHGYWSVDLDVLVTTARNDLPAFLIDVRAVEVSM